MFTVRQPSVRVMVAATIVLLGTACAAPDDHVTSKNPRTSVTASITRFANPSTERSATPDLASPTMTASALAANGKIAFAANHTGHRSDDGVTPSDIYTVNPDGSSLRRLTFTNRATNPVWSPDGTRIAYYKDQMAFSNHELWVMRADGAHPRRVLKSGPLGNMDWAPDGSRIAFDAPVGGLRIAIFVVELATGAVHQVGRPTRDWWTQQDPHWSGDGQQLAYVATNSGPGPDDYTDTMAIFTMDLHGGRVRRVPGTRDLLGFSWSWTDNRIVFGSGLATRNGECNGDLSITDPQLRGASRLLAQPCRQAQPAWSPDGQRVVYTSGNGLWVVDSNGQNAHEIVHPRNGRYGTERGRPYDPDWGPRQLP